MNRCSGGFFLFLTNIRYFPVVTGCTPSLGVTSRKSVGIFVTAYRMQRV